MIAGRVKDGWWILFHFLLYFHNIGVDTDIVRREHYLKWSNNISQPARSLRARYCFQKLKKLTIIWSKVIYFSFQSRKYFSISGKESHNLQLWKLTLEFGDGWYFIHLYISTLKQWQIYFLYFRNKFTIFGWIEGKGHEFSAVNFF